MPVESFTDKVFKEDFPFDVNVLSKEFVGCKFVKLDLTRFNFSGTSFQDCDFVGCNMSNIEVYGCSFQDVRFKECKIIGVNFSSINTFLHNWSFKKCRVEYCVFDDLKIKGSEFLECKIFDCSFIRVDLRESDFSESDFKSTLFKGCNLEKCNFVDSRRYFFDLDDNRVKKARFSYPEVLSLLEGYEIVIE